MSRERIERALFEAERDMANATEWLGEADSPLPLPDWWRWPTAADNRQVFVDLLADASRRYERALGALAELQNYPAELPEPDSDLFSTAARHRL